MERALAIDLGGTKLAVGVVDAEGRVLAREAAATPLGEARDVVALAARLSASVLARAGPARRGGVSLPGIVDRSSGALASSPSSGWRDVPFPALLSEALGMPLAFDNDVKACAFAESRLGAGRGLDSFFWLQVSTGIGGAACVGGRVLDGARGMAGEVGHLVVRERGAACGCGHRGCLEAEAAGPAWRREALALLDANEEPATKLRELPREAIDARTVAALARGGDRACLGIAERAGKALARGVAAIASVLDPQAIFLGGGVAGAIDLLAPVVERELDSLSLGEPGPLPRLLPSAIGYDAALVGAAALALFP